jgi:hypothetical protein
MQSQAIFPRFEIFSGKRDNTFCAHSKRGIDKELESVIAKITPLLP